MKNVTLQEVIDAAEKNGFPWNGHGYLNIRGGKCVLEQATINLGFSKGWVHLADALDDLRFRLGRSIWLYNDDEAESYQDAVKFLKDRLSQYPLDTVIAIEEPSW